MGFGSFLFASAALLALPAGGPQQTLSEDLAARIEAVRAEAKLPALGAALVTVDGLQGVWVTGTRRAGGEERVTSDDLWHLGSCTKSMTATLVALLVARGDLAWGTPIGEYLSDLEDVRSPVRFDRERSRDHATSLDSFKDTFSRAAMCLGIAA
jgi:CubicO group peptidase (beta-lactamase class C family)